MRGDEAMTERPDGESGFVRGIDALTTIVGRTASWLTLAMVLLTTLVVVLRYVFDLGFIWLQEGLTWMHAAVFMLGAAYTLQLDQHVRVDVFYREMSARRRALVNLIGVLIFLLPVTVFIFMESLGYVGTAWADQEVSRDAGGLPYPALPLMKSLLLAMPVLLALQGLAIALRSIATLRGSR